MTAKRTWQQRQDAQWQAGRRTAAYPEYWRRQGLDVDAQLARLYGKLRERLKQCERRLNAHIAASAKRKQKGA